MAATSGWPAPRAIVLGFAIGTLLAIANLYLALTIGFSDSGNVVASLLGFGLCTLLVRLGRAPTSPLETNEIQTIATGAGAVPIAIGLSAGIPALALGGQPAAAWAIAALGAGIAAVGLTLAVLVRRRLLADPSLRFPTGHATAELITALHGAEARRGLRRAALMAITSAVSAAIVWLRDGVPAVVPKLVALPYPRAGLDGGAIGFGLSPSPLLLSVGALVGPRTALSIFAGSAIAWVGLAPWLVTSGRVAGPDFGALATWLVWPGVAVMAGAVITDAIGSLRRFAVGRGDGRPPLAALGLGLAGCGAIAVAGFDTPLPILIATLALLPLGFVIAVRAAGETDIVPAGTLGTVTQAVLSPLAATAPAHLLVPGTLVAGVGSQGAASLWAWKAGALLGVDLRRQTVAMALGAGFGLAVAVPLYQLLLAAYPLGGTALPAPHARSWAATADALSRGGAALPAGSVVAVAIAAAVGALFAIVGATRWRRFALSPIALAIGCFLPFAAAATILIGGVAAWLVIRRAPGHAEELPVIASGGIIGEAVCGTAIAALIVTGVLSAG